MNWKPPILTTVAATMLMCHAPPIFAGSEWASGLADASGVLHASSGPGAGDGTAAGVGPAAGAFGAYAGVTIVDGVHRTEAGAPRFWFDVVMSQYALIGPVPKVSLEGRIPGGVVPTRGGQTFEYLAPLVSDIMMDAGAFCNLCMDQMDSLGGLGPDSTMGSTLWDNYGAPVTMTFLGIRAVPLPAPVLLGLSGMAVFVLSGGRARARFSPGQRVGG